MLSPNDGVSVYLACGSTDLRKSIDGLAALVTYSFKLDLFSNSLFVFCNAGRDKLKILYWDHNGFWLLYRRLERGRFKWPKNSGDQATQSISRRQLQWLLDGLKLEQHRVPSALSASEDEAGGAHAAVTARIMV